MRSVLSTLFYLLLILLVSDSVTYSQESGRSFPSIAISEFKTDDLPSELNWLGRRISDRLIADISKSETVRVLEREFLSLILDELGLQLTGLVESNNTQNIGEIIGADIFIVGTISMHDDTINVQSRVIDVISSEILGLATSKDIVDNIKNIEKKISDEIVSILALEAEMRSASDYEMPDISPDVYAELDRLKILAKELPLLGLDPARARKKADYLAAISNCDRIISANPNIDVAYYYKAIFNLHCDNFSDANNGVKIANELNPHSFDILFLSGNVFFAKDELDDAIEVFTEITTEFPKDARGWYGLGKSYLQKGETLKSLTSFITALNVPPEIENIETNLKTMLLGSNRDALLKGLGKTFPDYVPLAKILIAYWKNDWQDKEELSKKVVEEYPKFYLGFYVMGLIEQNRGNYQEAVFHFKQCLSLKPSFPRIHRELGIRFIETDNCLEGKQHVKLYLQLEKFVKDFAEIQNYLNQCEN